MDNYKGGRRGVSLLPRCRELRREATPAEQALWKLLRSRSLEGLKFRRQHQIGACIIDFYCTAHRLGIEVDGSQHRSARGRDFDAARTEYLKSLGVRIIRFTNAEARQNPGLVVRRILEEVKADS